MIVHYYRYSLSNIAFDFCVSRMLLCSSMDPLQNQQSYTYYNIDYQ